SLCATAMQASIMLSLFWSGSSMALGVVCLGEVWGKGGGVAGAVAFLLVQRKFPQRAEPQRGGSGGMGGICMEKGMHPAMRLGSSVQRGGFLGGGEGDPETGSRNPGSRAVNPGQREVNPASVGVVLRKPGGDPASGRGDPDA